jgi:hypothetical protein
VRILIPAAALLLGALAWSARAREVEELRRPTPATVTAAVEKIEEAGMPLPVEREAARVERRSEPSAETTSVVRPVVEPAAAFVTPGWASELGRELNLDERQRAWVAEILRERARLIVAYEREVRVRGWFRIDDFARRAGEIRETSYDRMDALMTPEQSTAFAGLRPGLIQKDFFSISIPETDVVCLD